MNDEEQLLPTLDATEGSDPAPRFTDRQMRQYFATEKIVGEFGKFEPGIGPDGAHYVPESPFADTGLVCANCLYYEGPRGCEVVDGDIDPGAICKLWIIPQDLVVEGVPDATPPAPDATKAANSQSTRAKPAERITGSDKNPEGSARSRSAASEITLTPELIAALEKKVADHNDAMRKRDAGAHRMATLPMLKAVLRRGMGAYSVSHRPQVTSRQQWAMARVNAFLKLLASGKPADAKYVSDNDLLPKGHERATKGAEPPTGPDRASALRLARRLGCDGAHELPDGSWAPCPTPAALAATVKDGPEGYAAWRKAEGLAPHDPERPVEAVPEGLRRAKVRAEVARFHRTVTRRAAVLDRNGGL